MSQYDNDGISHDTSVPEEQAPDNSRALSTVSEAQLPAITVGDIASSLCNTPALALVRAAVMDATKDPRQRTRRDLELGEIAQRATRIRNGTLAAPSLMSFLEAQGDDGRVAELALEYVKVVITQFLMPGGLLADRSVDARIIAGQKLGRLLQNLGVHKGDGFAFIAQRVLPQLSRTEEVALFQFLGVDASIRLGCPDIDVCTDDKYAHYIISAILMNYREEKKLGLPCTPTSEQLDLLGYLFEGLIDREGSQEEGYLPVNLNRIVENILASPYCDLLLTRLMTIARAENTLYEGIRLLFGQTPHTRVLAERLTDMFPEPDSGEEDY